MSQQGYGQPPYGAPMPSGSVRPPGIPEAPYGPNPTQPQQPQQRSYYPQQGAAPLSAPVPPARPSGLPPPGGFQVGASPMANGVAPPSRPLLQGPPQPSATPRPIGMPSPAPRGPPGPSSMGAPAATPAMPGAPPRGFGAPAPSRPGIAPAPPGGQLPAAAPLMMHHAPPAMAGYGAQHMQQPGPQTTGGLRPPPAPLGGLPAPGPMTQSYRPPIPGQSTSLSPTPQSGQLPSGVPGQPRPLGPTPFGGPPPPTPGFGTRPTMPGMVMGAPQPGPTQAPPLMARPSGPAMGLRPPGPPSGGVPPAGPSTMGMGQAPPPMGGMAMGMGGYDAMAALDAFESLSLGGGTPSMPGAGPTSGPHPATFPRPAGTPEQHDQAVGPPQPYSPANCRPEFVRLTSQVAPNSQALKARWHLPYGAIVHPMNEGGGQVPVANVGVSTIVRCKRCRTYMNPFMIWADGGRRFTCNICQMVNECPVDYFCALDASGRRIDANDRPELSSGSVEYIAPAEYMVRAPMPPTYVFLLDVSFAAIASGMLSAACSGIKACLCNLPGDDRTRVAIITYDSSIHFYSLRPGSAAPSMMVVPEIDDPFVPLPDELLVTLSESRTQLERLLDSLPASFAGNQRVDSAMGPALQAAFLVMNHVGGKLLLFQAAPPSAGIGRIKARDNPAVYGTDREYALRSPDDPFYKRFSAEASRFQICVDVFACGSVYQDLASLGALAKYTGGQLYYYPGFSIDKDGTKLRAEITRNLTRETAWEAVMRIRCSKGLRISSFHGHFFVRSTDLLALPACDADKVFAVEIQHEETVLTGQVAFVQAALLYTSSNGERRIRVHTLAMPVVSDLLEMYKASDAGATLALLAKVSVDRSLSAKLDDVRSGVQVRLTSALREYRMLHMRGPPGGGPPPSSLVLPERLKSIPLLTLGLLKTSALRGSGRDVNGDERSAVCSQLTTAPVGDILRLTYPSCYRVDDPAGNWGRVSSGPDGTHPKVELPATVPAGLEYFDPSGAYLIDTGRLMVLWLGTATPSAYYDAIFGAGAGARGDLAGLRVEPPRQGSELSARLCAVVEALRAHRELYQEVHVVRQGTPMEAHVMPYFIEDRMTVGSSLPGYLEWMMGLQKQVMAKA